MRQTRQTRNATHRVATAVLSTWLCAAAAQSWAAPLSMSEAEANGLDVGTAASAAPASRAQPGPVGMSTRPARDAALPRVEDAEFANGNRPLSKAAIAAREADERRRALLDEELRANPAQVVRDAPPATTPSYGEAAPRREPNRARDEDVPLSSTQKSIVRDVITTIREVVQHPLTWAAVAVLGAGAAVLSMGRHRRNAPASPRRALPAAPPPPPRVVATVRHRPRRRH